jgi:predicted deacylase
MLSHTESAALSAAGAVADVASPLVSTSSRWARAPEGGIPRAMKTIGDTVQDGERLGIISNPHDDTAGTEVCSDLRTCPRTSS